MSNEKVPEPRIPKKVRSPNDEDDDNIVGSHDKIESKPVRILSPMERASHSMQRSEEKLVKSTLRSQEFVHQHVALASKLREQRQLPPGCLHITLKMQYLTAVVEGRKPVEGRINTGPLSRAEEMSYVLFFSGSYCVLTRIVSKRTYSCFRDMLQDVTLSACLPGFYGSLDDAVRLYRSFPGYEMKETRHGVLALFLETVGIAELKSILSGEVQPRPVDFNLDTTEASTKKRKFTDSTVAMDSPNPASATIRGDSSAQKSETEQRQTASFHDRHVKRRVSYYGPH